MKNSKKVKQILSKLLELKEVVSFLTNGSDRYDKDFNEIARLIEDLGLERKENNIRLAKKLKGLWKYDEDSEKDS